MADDLNPYFQLANEFVNHTGKHIFLTGKAGTGKTTFLRHIAETSHKKMAVVAPTGVAAINAGGTTIHSMFQLPFGLFLPGLVNDWQLRTDFVTVNSLFKNLRLTREKKELLNELELLVIDEVSMLRADLLDEIDAVLRYVRKRQEPFGGLQMLYIGDLFQLPPVVKGEEWAVLKNYYKSPFFFDALVLKESPPVYIELKKIYRQHDEEFIRILNNIRNNEATTTDLERLQQHYRQARDGHDNEEIITLTTHNAKADAINRKKLDQLPGKIYNYKGIIEGEFSDKALPAEMNLQLKVGAQVMFLKNDKGEFKEYYNGKLATITELAADKIIVKFKGEPGDFELKREEWESIRYSYNRSSDSIDRDVLGTYKQYPIRLAWAITIHKSQGLTFEKAIVDAGEAFAPGQVYVALSRLTSLEGLTLYSKIFPNCIDTDPRVLEFAGTEKSNDLLQQELDDGQRLYFSRLLLQYFDFNPFLEQVQEHYDSYGDRELPDEAVCRDWVEGLLSKVKEQATMGGKFDQQLQQLLQHAMEDRYQHLRSRVIAAHDFFNKGLDELIASIKLHLSAMRIKAKSRKYVSELKILNEHVVRKKLALKQALVIADSLAQGEGFVNLPAKIREAKLEVQSVQEEPSPAKLAKGETYSITLQMFKEGKDIRAIAALRGLAISTIEGHLVKFIADGEVLVEQLVAQEKIEKIIAAIEETGLEHLAPLREKLGDAYSFTELRAVMNHYQRIKKLSSESL